MLNFVNYRGAPITSREQAYKTLITHTHNYGCGPGTWQGKVTLRDRLRMRVHTIKRSDFPYLVRTGKLRWLRSLETPFLDYFTQPAPAALPIPPPAPRGPALVGAPLTATATPIAVGQPVAPPPPRPIVPPDPGAPPAKPRGERYATMHPFGTDIAHSTTTAESLKVLTASGAQYLPDQSPAEQTFLVMWQVCAVMAPANARPKMHAWIMRLFNSLYWRGISCQAPRLDSKPDIIATIQQARVYNISIFASLDGTPPEEAVSDELAKQYTEEFSKFLKAKALHRLKKNELAAWHAHYNVPVLPDNDECVATGKSTTWAERDQLKRQQVECLDDCGACPCCSKRAAAAVAAASAAAGPSSSSSEDVKFSA